MTETRKEIMARIGDYVHIMGNNYLTAGDELLHPTKTADVITYYHLRKSRDHVYEIWQYKVPSTKKLFQCKIIWEENQYVKLI